MCKHQILDEKMCDHVNYVTEQQFLVKSVFFNTKQEFSSNATAGDEIEVPSYTKQYGAFAVMISSSASVGTSWYVIK